MSNECPAVVPVIYPSYADIGVIKNVPLTIESLHAPGSVHACVGAHQDLGGIPIHTCACSATFYYVRDAIRALVGQYEDLLRQLEVI